MIAVHPGEILGEKLAEVGMSQSEFARRMGLSAKHVNRIVKGRAGYSADVAVGMERVLGIRAALWLNLQANHELELARQRAGMTLADL